MLANTNIKAEWNHFVRKLGFSYFVWTTVWGIQRSLGRFGLNLLFISDLIAVDLIKGNCMILSITFFLLTSQSTRRHFEPLGYLVYQYKASCPN